MALQVTSRKVVEHRRLQSFKLNETYYLVGFQTNKGRHLIEAATVILAENYIKRFYSDEYEIYRIEKRTILRAPKNELGCFNDSSD